MSNRPRNDDDQVALSDVFGILEEPQGSRTAAIIGTINRLVKKDGSLSGGRACAASARAARQQRVGIGRPRSKSHSG